MRRLIFLFLLAASSMAAAVESHAVVFMYHRVGEDRYPSTSVMTEQFAAHLRWLADNHYEVWPLEQIVDYLASGRPIPDHTVALTFDDAYLSLYRRGYPLLRDRGWPFTVFVSTDPVDHRLPDYATWEQLREMAQHGGRFANHGASHAYLWKHRPGEDAAGWRGRITHDIEQGAARLHAELGEGFARKLFAYPYGEYDFVTAQLVTELGYGYAFGQHSGVLDANADWRGLPRFPMAERFASLKEFAAKAAALPLAVASAPRDPRVQENPPVLELRLAAAVDRRRLACFERGDPIKVEWLEGDRLRVVAPGPLQEGRARYSCTVPDGARFRWYTQPWLIPGK